MNMSILNTKIDEYRFLSTDVGDFNLYCNPLFHAIKIVEHNMLGNYDKHLDSLNFISQIVHIYKNKEKEDYMSLSMNDIMDIRENMKNIEQIDGVVISHNFLDATSTKVKAENLVEEIEDIKTINLIKIERLIDKLDSYYLFQASFDNGSGYQLKDLNDRDFEISTEKIHKIINVKNHLFSQNWATKIAKDDLWQLKEKFARFENISGESAYKDSIQRKIIPMIASDNKISALINKFDNTEDKATKSLISKELKYEIIKVGELLRIRADEFRFIDTFIREQELSAKLVEKESGKVSVRQKI